MPDSGGIYFVPAFSGLFAPYWQSDARGVIVGLTRFINKGHICRAALEATAYQTREVLDAMEQDSGVQLTALKVDGGMVYNELLMQFQADILGVPVVRPDGGRDDRARRGVCGRPGRRLLGQPGRPAPQLAGRPHLAAGRWARQTRAKLYRGWRKAVERSMHWLEE